MIQDIIPAFKSLFLYPLLPPQSPVTRRFAAWANVFFPTPPPRNAFFPRIIVFNANPVIS
jgi:hypothetical protein